MTRTLQTKASNASPRDTLRLPDFYVIGAAKCGTSTLAAHLATHPRIFMSPIKEPEFFAVDEVFGKGLEWYGDLFREASADQQCGEASTAYTRSPQFPEAAQRIAAATPNAKFIYLMRHPVDRAYSHYVHRLTKELFPRQPIRRTFEAHVALDPMCLDGSRYMDQIQRYLDYFPKESILCLFSEFLRSDPQATVNTALEFLGLEPAPLQDTSLQRNETARQRRNRIRAHVTGRWRDVPVLNRVVRALPQSWRDQAFRFLKWTPYGRWMTNRHTPRPMRPETRAKLLAEFAPSNAALRDFLGRDLPDWTT